MIYSLFLLITILMIVSVVLFERDATAPAFLLCFAFWVATFCACLYAEQWEFQNNLLITVVLIGLCSFILGSWITYIIYRTGRRATYRKPKEINISNGKLIIYLIFQVFLFVLSLLMMVRNVGTDIFGGQLSSVISNYYEMNRQGSLVYSSSIVSVGNILNFSMTYFLIYVVCTNKILKQKNNPLIYINLILSLLESLVSGTKTSFYMYIIGAIIIAITLKSKSDAWKNNLNIKLTMRIIIIMCALLSSFIVLNSLQGRTLTGIKTIDTLATYLGSPLKNLEIYLTEQHDRSTQFGVNVFRSIYNDIFEITGRSGTSLINFYRYRWINGFGLGNVYTIFMPIYQDFGMFGVVTIMGIMGVFSQTVYNIMKYRAFNYRIDYYIIFYGYLAFAIMFSFFSNKFFELIVAKAGIYFLLGIWIANLFFVRTSFNGRSIFIERAQD